MNTVAILRRPAAAPPGAVPAKYAPSSPIEVVMSDAPAAHSARVPKFTLVVGGSFGAGNYGMCGRAFGPRMMWMWPNARISVMGGPQAAGVLRTVKDAQRETAGEPPLSEEEAREITDPVLQKYETEGSAWFASARLWDDGVIDPRETRAVLARAIEVSRYQPWPDRSHSVFRM